MVIRRILTVDDDYRPDPSDSNEGLSRQRNGLSTKTTEICRRWDLVTTHTKANGNRVDSNDG